MRRRLASCFMRFIFSMNDRKWSLCMASEMSGWSVVTGYMMVPILPFFLGNLKSGMALYWL